LCLLAVPAIKEGEKNAGFFEEKRKHVHLCLEGGDGKLFLHREGGNASYSRKKTNDRPAWPYPGKGEGGEKKGKEFVLCKNKDDYSPISPWQGRKKKKG